MSSAASASLWDDDRGAAGPLPVQAPGCRRDRARGGRRAARALRRLGLRRPRRRRAQHDQLLDRRPATTGRASRRAARRIYGRGRRDLRAGDARDRPRGPDCSRSPTARPPPSPAAPGLRVRALSRRRTRNPGRAQAEPALKLVPTGHRRALAAETRARTIRGESPVFVTSILAACRGPGRPAWR